ncbi:MAG: hypothetical protein JRI23_01325, partial [Deltaproteobacteria bacterium]|nr:hypothetical protein [Deltaproteobacteria bacterium]MBW2530096.1 hypothetical protein [Deltaproteobacteria bacterium]
GAGGTTVVTTCTEWSVGGLGNLYDATGDVDVRYFEYRFVGDVLEVRVEYTPFNPATVTNQPGLQLWDDGGLNLVDLYWSGTAAVFAVSTDGGTNWSALPADPDLTVDVTSALSAGLAVYTVPVDVLTTHLTAATVPSELFAGAYAYLPASGFTDGVLPYPSTATNLNWTTRDQCFYALASNIDPQGDTLDFVDYGAISYNAESARIRVRIDLYFETTFGQQEVQAYFWDQSIVSGNAAFLFDAYDGQLYLGVRNSAGVWNYSPAPGSCITYPGVLTSATRLLTIDCPQSDVATVIASDFGEFVFNAAHAYRMGGLTWSELGVEDDEFPDGWVLGGGFGAFDPIVIP